MWPDNETDIDLLGFDFLVDELLVLLKEPRLQMRGGHSGDRTWFPTIGDGNRYLILLRCHPSNLSL